MRMEGHRKGGKWCWVVVSDRAHICRFCEKTYFGLHNLVCRINRQSLFTAGNGRDELFGSLPLFEINFVGYDCDTERDRDGEGDGDEDMEGEVN
jgi:hypothetical protein